MFILALASAAPGSTRGPGSAGLMVSVLPIRNKPRRHHETLPANDLP
jgi:hypothetical protein